jgi:Ca2+-binding RTX toxin-like protein
MMEVEMSSSSMSRRDGGAYRRAGLTVALALAALAALPAVASAAIVSSAAGTITYQAVAGETNSVVVDDPGSTYTFAETPITAGVGCTQTNANLVTCSDSGVNIVVMNMDDMGDTANATASNQDPFTINGGTGNDTIALSDFNGDVGNGGDGNDVLFGDSGTDTLNGDAGNDRMDGGTGSSDDVYDGGSGIDRVVYGILTGFTYTCTDQSVVVTMENTANDHSCADEDKDTDNVRDTVESVTGSTLGDTITGSCFANTFAGDPGGANGSTGGADILSGDPNTCSGGNGTDFMGGGEGNDVFDGDGTTGAVAFDTVTYGTPFTGAVAATCSGQAVTTGFAVNLDTDNSGDDCDGFGNTSENVHSDIERIIGSGAADRINATAAGQGVNLFGRLGNDTLIGSGFGDFLDGEGGIDSLTCLGGFDTYRDDENEDTIAADCEAEV